MNPSSQSVLRRYGQLYFLALETLVIAVQVFVVFSADSWGRSPLLPHRSPDFQTNLFKYIGNISFLLFICSQPFFFWISRKTGRIALTTLVVVTLVYLLTPEL
jgi:hypothetical protein